MNSPGSSVKVNASRKDSLGRRLIKFLRYAGGLTTDVQETFEVGPFGIDAAPLKNQIAVYLQTNKIGKPVIIGYINKDQKSNAGEIRIFSKDSTGSQKTSIWLKANGTIVVEGTSIEILGSSNHMVQFEALKTGFDQLKTSLNNFITIFNAHVHPTAAPGAPSPSPTPGTPASATIDSAKLDNVKTA